MARKFPHLKPDTAFPHLNTVRPYDIDTGMDYGRYDYTSLIKLCNVPWPQDYRHTVDWHGEEDRDAWFDALDGRVIELENGFTHVQTERIRVDVPLDVCLTYNYVYMRVPQLTRDEAIERETTPAIRTICAFISNCDYLSPSTTEVWLSVDVWTTYLPHLETPSMMLARGHAPMWATSARDYLKDPINNCSDLLTPDVNYGADAGVTRGGEFLPLDTGPLCYVLAMNIPYELMSTVGTATSASSSGPTYYDLETRDGHQVGVSGYRWAPLGRDYSNLQIPSGPTRADGSTPTGLWYYAIHATDVAGGAMSKFLDDCPVILKACQACYVVPENLVRLGSALRVAGVDMFPVYSRGGLQKVGDLEVTADLFGYPERYADIAKLYTAPYAHLEVSDDMGNAVEVMVEDVAGGAVRAAQMLDIAWPALTWDVVLENVASKAPNVAYKWRELDGTLSDKALPGADFRSNLMSFGVPTYALYLSARVDYAMSQARDAEIARESAIVSYQSTMRSANTAKENANASNSTAETNTGASADTSVANTARSGATATANVNRSSAASQTNTATSNAMTTTLNDTNTDAAIKISNEGQYKSSRDYNAQVDLQQITFAAQESAAAIATVTNTISAAVSGDIAGAVSAGIGGAVSICTDAVVQSAALDQAAAAFDSAKTYVANTTVWSNAMLDANVVTKTRTATSITDVNAATANANAAATQATGNANAGASAATSKANAARSRSTGDSNAGYTRTSAERNAKAALELAQDRYDAQVGHARVAEAVQRGAYSGDTSYDVWQARGLHLRAVTQSDAAIARAGDAFIRYGYAYDGFWTIDSWTCGRRYCHWQSTDANVKWGTLNPSTVSSFESMLAAGVTVWARPEDIGRYVA